MEQNTSVWSEVTLVWGEVTSFDYGAKVTFGGGEMTVKIVSSSISSSCSRL